MTRPDGAPPLDIAAIRARADAARSGPWLADDSGVGGISAYARWLGVGPQGDALGRGFDVAHVEKTGDAEFIAAARTDVPALCDRVEALEETLQVLGGIVLGGANDQRAQELLRVIREALGGE